MPFSDGGLFANGWCGDYGSVLKLNRNGIAIWQKRGNFTGEISAVIEVDAGHLIAAGKSGRASVDGLFIMELESDGDVVWSQAYAVGSVGELFSMIPAKVTGYVAVGKSLVEEALLLRPDNSGRIGDCDLDSPLDLFLASWYGYVTLTETSSSSREITSHDSYLATPVMSDGDLVVTQLCPSPPSQVSSKPLCQQRAY